MLLPFTPFSECYPLNAETLGWREGGTEEASTASAASVVACVLEAVSVTIRVHLHRLVSPLISQSACID